MPLGQDTADKIRAPEAKPADPVQLPAGETGQLELIKKDYKSLDKPVKAGLLLAGYKGILLLPYLLDYPGIDILFISSYKVRGTRDNSSKIIKETCREKEIDYIPRKSLNGDAFKDVDRVFVVGWQYLIDECDDKFVVLHDSYLPELRGWCPTVTALLSGKKYLGATGFVPDEGMDTGPIYSRHKIPITYPIKLEEAYKKVAEGYSVIIKEIIEDELFPDYSLQDESQGNIASYSIWRGPEDMFIDWSMDAEYIKRFVDALGFPFTGAKTRYDGREIVVEEVEVLAGKYKFELNQPGKIFNINGNQPLVLCGDGLIKITRASEANGEPAVFDRLKVRLV
ncbi:MAG: hypothetical protein GF307_13820 [candidate division Zixibacteria bacterium]|nr:hypothetical protein [candidate division Zixibacteria bacterium]